MIIYGGDYEHTLSVTSERDGLKLDYRPTPIPDLFPKVLQRQPFDVCEFSLANYITMRNRGADWLVAIPIFPNRSFRHGTLMVRKDSTIESFAELRGRRVGIADYSMTGGVWTRGLLAEIYGVHWSEIDWVSTSQPRFVPPTGVRISLVKDDLEDMLAEGRIDALLDPASRDAVLPFAGRRFRPLLRDHETQERPYYRQTGIFPIHHTLVIDREALGREPRLPAAVYAAYCDSMAIAKRRRLGASFIPWSSSAWGAVMDFFDEEPLQYGLSPANRKVIDKLQDYLLEQQLINRRLTLAELFVTAEETEPRTDGAYA
jgi:4,5-dihydroxyphthalate decarboxylase